MMTAKELIAELKKVNPEAPVVIPDGMVNSGSSWTGNWTSQAEVIQIFDFSATVHIMHEGNS